MDIPNAHHKVTDKRGRKKKEGKTDVRGNDKIME